MSKEKYEITDQCFYLIDSELGLDLKMAFDLPLLPKDLAKDDITEKLIVERDDDGNYKKAYFDKSSKLHGQYYSFYPSGAVQMETFYHEGTLHGPSIFYSNDGKVLSKSWFCFGLQQGKALQYYLSGQLYSLQRFKNGQREGKQEYYYEDGKIKTFLTYEKGTLHGDVSLFWPSGTAKRICYFQHGKKHGWDKIWTEERCLLDAGEYHFGEPIGIHRFCFPSGTVREEINYYSANSFDKKQWDKDGKLISEIFVKCDGKI